MGKFVMELVKRETHEEEKQALFFPGARTRPREFSLPSKKPCIFYAGCNINQFAPGMVRESKSLGFWIPLSGFRIPGTGFQFQSLVGFWIPRAIIQIPKARILDTTSKCSPIPGQQAKFSGFTYMWQSQSNTSKLY